MTKIEQLLKHRVELEEVFMIDKEGYLVRRSNGSCCVGVETNITTKNLKGKYTTRHILWILKHKKLPKGQIGLINDDPRASHLVDLSVYNPPEKSLTLDYLNMILKCDAKKGKLYWKERPGDKQFNSNYAGKEAGCLNEQRYLVVRFNNNKLYQHHHIIWWMATGKPINQNMVIDHINGIRDDNRISNIREVSKSENSLNRENHRNGKETGTVGVFYDKTTNRWSAYYRGLQKYFKTEKEAIKQRNEWEKEGKINPNFGYKKREDNNISGDPPQELVRELFDYIKQGGLRRKSNGNELFGGRKIISVKGYKQTLLHRLIYIYHYGSIEKNNDINHIDQNPHNNKISNLESVSRRDNMKCCRKPKHGKNEHQNITIRILKDGTEVHDVKITTNGKKFIQTCYTLKEAIHLRDRKLKEFGFHKNHGRCA